MTKEPVIIVWLLVKALYDGIILLSSDARLGSIDVFPIARYLNSFDGNNKWIKQSLDGASWLGISGLSIGERMFPTTRRKY